VLVSSTRPTEAELAAAVDATLDDVIAPGLDVLFCGINPGLWSAATGHHFARPGNRFWPALHLSGFTPRQLRPDEQWELLDHGLGITNLVTRATARAEELTTDELRAGGKHLLALVEDVKPRALAVVGLGAYRTAFGDKTVTVGPRPHQLGDTLVWVLPNPSGLNAHWQLPDLAAEFSRLRDTTRSRRRRPR
jgi:double-stranded uracil-DNA glycosylase